jgi:Suppressor of fused protein (SUFU)
MDSNSETLEHDFHAIDLHLRNVWADHEFEDFRWTLGPIAEVLPRFRVRRIAPASESDSWVYVSMGAFEVTDGQRVEFIIDSPEETPYHVESLAIVAHFHATSGHPLHVNRTVNLGRPWMEGASANGFLLSLPYPFGKRSEWCQIDDGSSVQFLWLVPITPSEAEYAAQNGADALETLFEEREVDTLDPFRESVV